MRDRGFGFRATNQADTVTVTIQVHWNDGTAEDDVTETLTRAYAEAFARVMASGEGTTHRG